MYARTSYVQRYARLLHRVRKPARTVAELVHAGGDGEARGLAVAVRGVHVRRRRRAVRRPRDQVARRHRARQRDGGGDAGVDGGWLDGRDLVAGRLCRDGRLFERGDPEVFCV